MVRKQVATVTLPVPMTTASIIRELKSHANPDNVAGMARFGIASEGTLGVSIPVLRKMAKRIGKNHDLAGRLWASGIHEARILASLVEDPTKVRARQIDAWVKDLDSWDVCDQCCMNLFDKTRFAWDRAVRWSTRKEEFVKRAAFALMASLSVHDKEATDEQFIALLPVIERESVDDRNYVRKAVNWALRQIGKRNRKLNRAAIQSARRIAEMDAKGARWIASDALRELTSDKIRKSLK